MVVLARVPDEAQGELYMNFRASLSMLGSRTLSPGTLGT